MPRTIAICFTATLLGISVFGQDSGSRFDALKQALMLSDSQLEQLQKNLSQPPRGGAAAGPAVPDAPAGSFFGGRVDIYTPGDPAARRSLFAARTNYRVDAQRQLLTDEQRTKLDEIAKAFMNGPVANVAIRIGLITRRQWGSPICLYPIRSYGTKNGHAQDPDLTLPQIDQLQQMERSSKLLWVLASEYEEQSLRTDSDLDSATLTPVEARAALEKLRTDVRAVLDDKQRTIIAQFTADLELANQSAQLLLVPPPVHGDALCP